MCQFFINRQVQTKMLSNYQLARSLRYSAMPGKTRKRVKMGYVFMMLTALDRASLLRSIPSPAL
nr:hypothetical protein Q903MT_gene2861 [Picea sitchensis]